MVSHRWYRLVTDAEGGTLLGQTDSLVRLEGAGVTLTATGNYLFVAGLCHVEKL